MTLSDPGNRIFTKQFCLAFVSSLFYFSAMGLVLPVLPLFVTHRLHGGNLTVGIVVGVFAASAVVARPLAGRLGNRLGVRFLMVVGTALVAVSTALYGLAGGVGALIVLRLVSGAGEGAYFTGSATFVADLAPVNRRAQVMSYFSVALYAGLGLGPVLGQAIYDRAGPGDAFAAAGGLALLGLLVSTQIRDTRRAHAGHRPTHLFSRSAVGPGIVLMLGIMGITAFQAYVPLYSQRLHMAGPQWVFLLYSAVVLVSRIAGAPVADRIGVSRIAVAATTFVVGGLCVMAAWASPLGLYVGTALFGAGISLQYPALMTLVVNRVPAEERSSAVGTFTMAFDVSQGLSGFLFGFVASVASYRATFATAAGCALVGLVILLGRVGRRADVRQPPGSHGPAPAAEPSPDSRSILSGKE